MTQTLNSISSPQITHSVVVVTPEMAKRWLGTNANNRRLRDARIAKYRGDMEEGRWTFAGDPIRFDVNGNLVDGQHRLLALADAAVSGVGFLVIRGLPPEAQSVMDQGAKRTAGDQLQMRGVKNAASVAAAVKQFMIWEQGLLFRDTKVVHSEISTPAIEQWVRNHSIEVEHLNESMHYVRQCESRPMVGGAAFLIFQAVDAAGAAEFFHRLATGAGTSGDPINTLDQKLRRQRRAGQRVTARDELATFIQAWNAWRDGRTVTQLLRPKGGAWTPKNFPVAR